MADPKSGLGLSFVKGLDSLSRVLWKKASNGTAFRFVKVRYDSAEGPSTVHLEDVLVTAVGYQPQHDGAAMESVSLECANWWVE